MNKPHVCPVCGQFMFESTGEFEICEVCGWEDDWVQLDDPNEEECANKMSLNQARKAWANGEEVR